MKTNKHIQLNEIGKELPFALPENYFEQFAADFDKQIHKKTFSIGTYIKPWMYVAAVFVGLLITSSTFYKLFKKDTTPLAENYEQYVLSQVDETAVVDYYVNGSAK